MASAASSTPVATPAPRCEPTCTLTARAPRAARCRHLATHPVDPPGVDRGVRRGEVDQVRRVHQEPDVPGIEERPEAVEIGQWCRPARAHAVGSSVNTWMADAPSDRARSAVRSRPSRMGTCGPTRRPARPSRARAGSMSTVGAWAATALMPTPSPGLRWTGLPLTALGAQPGPWPTVSEPESLPRRHTLREKVLHAFVVDGRLVSIPARERKRRIILRWLATTDFEPDRDYPERDVDMRLALRHRDVAALRRLPRGEPLPVARARRLPSPPRGGLAGRPDADEVPRRASPRRTAPTSSGHRRVGSMSP